MNIGWINASSCFGGQDKFVLMIFRRVEEYANTEY